DEVAFGGEDGFPADGVELEFQADGTYAIYQLPRAVAPDPDIVLANDLAMDSDPDKSDQLVFRGVTLHLEGTPVGGETVRIELNDSSGEVKEKQGILDTIANL